MLCRDGMVRAAVRTLTLNVYSIPDPDVQAFVVSPPASNYFTELAIYIADQCQVLRHTQTKIFATGTLHSDPWCSTHVCCALHNPALASCSHLLVDASHSILVDNTGVCWLGQYYM